MCMRTWSTAGIALLILAGAVVARPQDMPKPSPEHAYLKKIVGNWDCTMNMMGQKFKCTHKSEMLGDFWVVGKFSGDLGGMKFEGRDSCGWDPIQKKYVSNWIDNMSPHIMTLTGTFNPATKTMTCEGTGINMENKPTKYKEVTTWKNDDEFSFTMAEEKNGKFEEVFVIEYKRSK